MFATPIVPFGNRAGKEQLSQIPSFFWPAYSGLKGCKKQLSEGGKKGHRFGFLPTISARFLANFPASFPEGNGGGLSARAVGGKSGCT
jgi:hypothetical protein